MLKRITAIAILVVLLSPIIRSSVSAQVVIKERVEVQAPQIPLANMIVEGCNQGDIRQFLPTNASETTILEVDRTGTLHFRNIVGEFFGDPTLSVPDAPEITILVRGADGEIRSTTTIVAGASEQPTTKTVSCAGAGKPYQEGVYAEGAEVSVQVEAGDVVELSCDTCSAQFFMGTGGGGFVDADGNRYYLASGRANKCKNNNICQCLDGDTELESATSSRMYFTPAPPAILDVIVVPDSIDYGFEATIDARFASASGQTERVIGGVAAVSVPNDLRGSLEYLMQRGVSFTDVAFSEVAGSKFRYVADGTESSQEAIIGVTVSACGLTGSDNLVIRPGEALYTLRMIADPDTVTDGEESRLWVETVDETGNVVDPGDINLNFSLPGEFKHGGIFYSGAELGPDAPVPFTAARSGAVTFEALVDTTSLSTLFESTEVTVKAVDDPGITAADSVTVQIFELELALEKSSIWPEIPKVSSRTPIKGAPNTFDFASVDDSTTITVTIRPQLPTELVTDLELTKEWVMGSGGHVHAGGNDTKAPPDTLLGIVYLSDTDSGSSDPEVRFTLQSETSVGFKAPFFGGKLVLHGEFTIGGDTLRVSSDTLSISVPGLVLLPNSEHYDQIGGTLSHPGPPGSTSNTNHYVNPAVAVLLDSLAARWSRLAADSTYGIDESEYPLEYNDISLPNGGRFDISGNWTNRQPSYTQHQYHRVGRDLDLRTNSEASQRASGVGLDVQVCEANICWYKNRLFEKLVEDLNGTADVHERNTRIEHYHLQFY